MFFHGVKVATLNKVHVTLSKVHTTLDKVHATLSKVHMTLKVRHFIWILYKDVMIFLPGTPVY
jgi:hypothetical protein